MKPPNERDEEILAKLGNMGARSWLSRQILERGADLATFFGMRGMARVEDRINCATGRLLAWSIRRDRRRWKDTAPEGDHP